MNKLDFYILRNVLSTTLGVLFLIVSLYLVFSLVDELDSLRTNYQVKDALYFVFLTAPQKTYEVLPMAAMVGCLIGLGNLASSSELTVMRASGVSLAQIVLAVIKPTLILLLAGLILGEYLVPITESKAQAFRSFARKGEINSQIADFGLWHKIGDEFIHINSVKKDSSLEGVARYKFENFQKMQQASFAAKGQYQNDAWHLSNLIFTKFKQDQIKTSQEASYMWQVELDPTLLKVLTLKPNTLSITDLWRYSHYLTAQGLSSEKYWLSFWTKILQPLITLSLVILAISFIFGPLRTVTLGQRIFTGVLVGFIFSITQDLLGPASLVFGFTPFLAVISPSFVCLLCGFYLLNKAG